VPHDVQLELVADALPVAYLSWYDSPVMMRVASEHAGGLEEHLLCTITSESNAAVHIYVGDREQDVSKKLILAVEELAEPRFLQ
jgi:hypothetical protein